MKDSDGQTPSMSKELVECVSVSPKLRSEFMVGIVGRKYALAGFSRCLEIQKATLWTARKVFYCAVTEPRPSKGGTGFNSTCPKTTRNTEKQAD